MAYSNPNLRNLLPEDLVLFVVDGDNRKIVSCKRERVPFIKTRYGSAILERTVLEEEEEEVPAEEEAVREEEPPKTSERDADINVYKRPRDPQDAAPAPPCKKRKTITAAEKRARCAAFGTPNARRGSSRPKRHVDVTEDLWRAIFSHVSKGEIYDVLANLASACIYFKNFVKIFYWAESDRPPRCRHGYHPFEEIDAGPRRSNAVRERKIAYCESPSKSLAAAIPKCGRWNCDCGKASAYDYEPVLVPHYYCTACFELVQCGMCVFKKDWMYTTQTQLERTEHRACRTKKHVKKAYLTCPLCKTAMSLIKRWSASVV
jgi:hypothetical protein